MSRSNRSLTLTAAALLWTASPLPAAVESARPSPAQRRVDLARRALQGAPQSARAHTDLAMALARRARETSDPRFYDEARGAVMRALALAPDDLEARKVEAWLLLGRHEFVRALELAKSLNRRAPDDVMVYGLLVDAHVELGQYDAAERAAQWMLDLRPGEVPGVTRAAYLRELFGDLEGARELMEGALVRIPNQETEERAWILTQVGHLYRAEGALEAAEAALDAALAAFPDYHYALGELARLRAAQGRDTDAAEALQRRYRLAPHPENLFELGVALERAGRRREAHACFDRFEADALREADSADNANRELAFYYADHAGRPADALRVARAELARRRDIHTRDAYAWALHKAGRHAEAREQIQAALAVGTREAAVHYHAGVIASALGRRGEAVRHLESSLASPGSAVAPAARALLGRLRH